MQHRKTFGPMRLVSSTDTPRPTVSRWVPPSLEQPATKSLTDVQQRSLNEISDDIAILSLQAGKILQLLAQTEGPQAQSLRHLAERLEHELSELLIVAQSLQG